VNRDVETSKKGILLNRPNFLEFAEGDVLAIDFDNITDWMYQTKSATHGMFSIREMMKNVSKGEARKMARQHGLPAPA
jgi:uncharacterized protein YegJ (DUF2314 family)